MPVSVITDVVTWIEMIAQIGITTLELGTLTYLIFFGGWLDMIRLISFWLDVTIIKYIDQFYSYFGKILGGQIFSPTVVENVMSKVYIFVALIVMIKVMMLFMKYLVNPEMVNDDKIGTSALVKRVILGMCGMLFLPTAFDLAINIQKAVLNDNLFGKLLLDKGEIRAYEKNKDQMGRVLAFNVYQSFWNLDTSRVTDTGFQKKYKQAIEAKDPSAIGGMLAINSKYGDDYAIDYFPIASSVVLIYVLYLIIKYCIDVVVRMFKLFLLQMLGPLAISDYMVNGDSKEVFKNWLKTTISVYAMLFVRIFSIWFIAFITILMNQKCTTSSTDGICTDSLLYIVEGQEPDYLLRGIITLGLLALLMDLPKFLSDVLGMDLEQDATVKGLMQKVGGAAKGVATAGLAFGGAAVGGAVGAAKGFVGQTKFGKNLSQSRQKLGDKHGNLAALGKQGTTLGKGLIGAAMNSNSFTGSFAKGYSSQSQAQQSVADKSRQEKSQREKEKQEEQQRKEDVTRNIYERLAETASKDASKEQLMYETYARVNGVDSAGKMTAEVEGRISAINSTGAPTTTTEVTQVVNQVMGDTLNVSPAEIEQVVNQVVKNPSNVTPQEVEQIVNQVYGKAVEQDSVVTQVVNQEYGTRVNNSVDDATQVINQKLNEVDTSIKDQTQTISQKLDTQISLQEDLNVYADIATEHVENIDRKS